MYMYVYIPPPDVPKEAVLRYKCRYICVVYILLRQTRQTPLKRTHPLLYGVYGSAIIRVLRSVCFAAFVCLCEGWAQRRDVDEVRCVSLCVSLRVVEERSRSITRYTLWKSHTPSRCILSLALSCAVYESDALSPLDKGSVNERLERILGTAARVLLALCDAILVVLDGGIPTHALTRAHSLVLCAID